MALSKEKTKLLGRLKNPRIRPKEGQFIVEGLRAVREYVEKGPEVGVRFAIVSPRLSGTQGGRVLMGTLSQVGVPIDEVSDTVLGELSDTKHPQGVLLVVRDPRPTLSDLEGGATRRVLLLDGIQDPGNAGTLMRAAWAFGADAVIALDGTVDPFNPKVVRSSAGATAHIPVLRLPWSEAWRWMEEGEIPLLAADAGGEDLTAMAPPSGWALAIGNEATGCRREVLDAAFRTVAIPMRPEVDSLNAGMAGTILLFALTLPIRTTAET